MALSIRTILIDAAAIDSRFAQGVRFKFYPTRTEAASGEILLIAPAMVRTDALTIATVNLPVKATGTIQYTCEIGFDSKFGKFDFYLNAGAPISLSELFAGGTAPTQTINDYINSLLAGFVPTARTVNGKALTANIQIAPIDLTQDAAHRFASDAEKQAWNAKQPALVFAPENTANKAIDFAIVDNTKFPSVQAAKTYTDAAQTQAVATIRNGVATAGDDLSKLYNLITAINSIIGGITPDADSLVNTVSELLAVFATYSEGVDAVTLINSKLAKSANLSDLTDALASRQNLGVNTTVNQTDSLNKRFATDAQLAAIAANTSAVASKADISNPTFTTGITTPLTIGGSGVASPLILRSTSGIGAIGADIILQTGNNGVNEAVRILNSGNVGIGTAIPTEKLHVVGNALISGTVGIIGNGTSSAPSIRWTDDSTTGFYKSAATIIDVTAGGTQIIRMSPNGNFYLKKATFSFDAGINWESGTAGTGAADAGLIRGAVGVVKVTNGSTGFGSLQAGTLFLSDGTVKQVTYGAIDSGGVGFKIMRIPN